ncbi:MAG: hypothetical protein ABSG25_04110 [Bryobacteraceae bacterium]
MKVGDIVYITDDFFDIKFKITYINGFKAGLQIFDTFPFITINNKSLNKLELVKLKLLKEL